MSVHSNQIEADKNTMKGVDDEISVKSTIIMATMFKIPMTMPMTFVLADVGVVSMQQDSKTVGIHAAGCNLSKLTKFQTNLRQNWRRQ